MKTRLKHGIIIFAFTISFITVYAASPSDIVARDAETDGGNGFTELQNAIGVDTFTIGANTYAIVTGFGDNGVQIIDISDPTNIVARDTLDDADAVGLELERALGVATFTIGASTYAIVASYVDNGVQIIDISDPTNIVAKDAETDDANGFTTLEGASDVDTFTIGASTYAIVASFGDNGVQIIDISDPTNIVAKDAETDGANGFTQLRGPYGVDTFTIGASTYAIVTSSNDHGVQIIDISDPTNIVATDAETDGANGFTELDNAQGVDTFTIGASTYAIVASFDDNGVQIIDISDPTNIIAKDAETDGANGFTELQGAEGVATFTIGASTYAIVTAADDHGVQIIDISDPTNIIAKDAETDDANGFTTLDGSYGVDTFTIGDSTYAIVTAADDHGVQMIELYTPTTGSSNKHLTRPTFGISHETYRPVVTEGFSFNGQTFDITDNWHTDFERQSIIIGQNNTFAAKVYAPKDLRIQEFLFGIPKIGEAHNAELGVEVHYDYQGNVDGAKIIQKTDVIDAESFSGISYPSKCMPSDTDERCVTTEVTLRFLEPLQYDVMAIKAIDWDGRPQTTYLNEGFDISGDSLNPMKTISIAGNVKYEGMITVTQNAKYSKYWTAQDGRVFERNDYGTFTMIPQEFTRYQDSGEPLTRMHSEYSALIQIEKTKAYLTMKKLYPDYLDEPYDKINDIVLWTEVDTTRHIDYDEMKRQEVIAQKIMDKIMLKDILERYKYE